MPTEEGGGQDSLCSERRVTGSERCVPTDSSLLHRTPAPTLLNAPPPLAQRHTHVVCVTFSELLRFPVFAVLPQPSQLCAPPQQHLLLGKRVSCSKEAPISACSMNNVIKQIKRCFTIYSALLITLITTRIRGHQTGSCGQEQLVQCAKPISVFTDSGLTFATSKTDLEKICPDLKAALKCIHSYTRMCMNLQHRKHFRELFHSTGVMVHELCNNSTYQEEYLKYAPCMKEVAAENEVCFSRYSTAMTSISSNAPQIQNESEPNSIFQKKKREAADEGIKSVCCTFREYVDCSTHTMRRACGEDAALFSRNFLDRMSSSMIKHHCSSYGLRQCGLGSGAGLSASRASLVSVAASAVLALLLRFSMS